MALKTQKNQFSNQLTPEDLNYLTQDTLTNVEKGMEPGAFDEINQGTIDAVNGQWQNIQDQMDLSGAMYQSQIGRTNANFKLNIKDIENAAKEAGKNINVNALQRGVFTSGFIKDDRQKLNEDVAMAKGKLQIGLGYDLLDSANSLSQALLSLQMQGLLSTSDLTLEELAFANDQLGTYGGVAMAANHPDGYKGPNGYMPQSALQPIDQQGNMLTPTAAFNWQALTQEAQKAGITFSVLDSYRSYDEQVYLYNTLGDYSSGGAAAKPGHSNHGLGLALDLRTGSNDKVSYSSKQYAWLSQNGPAYGFYNIPREPWHWEYRGGGKPLPGAKSSSSTASPSNNSIITAPTGPVSTIGSAQ